MAFDYCTPAEAFAYGGSAGSSTDPINEQAEMATIVTAASRAIDAACQQALSLTTYAAQRLRARVDRDGVLVVNLPVPTVASVTGVRYRVGAALSWIDADLSAVDVEEHPHGSVLRALTTGITDRTARVAVELDYTGGYASAAAMPADLRWACCAASWYEFQRRSAPLDKTAMPGMGVVILPGDWPPHIKTKLIPYTRVVSS